MKKIYKKISGQGIPIGHVAEVGVYFPETSNVIDFIEKGIKTTLVEADPEVNKRILEAFKGKNISLYPFAVWDYNGTLKLSRANASTFVTQLSSSPAIKNDSYVVKEEDTFEVPCITFSKADDGTIDLLSIDIEGSEWYVLKHMISRPKVLSIETHGKYYINPFINEIKAWIEANGYITWFKDRSDTVFVRKDVLAPSLSDRIETSLVDLSLAWKKFKGILKGKV
jgi:FkbM family methyltransferase